MQRTLKFVKYLPQYGWHPTVLSLHPDAHYPKDFTLQAEIPENVKIARVQPYGFRTILSLLKKMRLGKLHSDIMKYISIPDGMNEWISSAFFKALELHGRFKFDAVYTTAPSYSTHIAGMLFARRTRVPWVADFRDEWTSHPELQCPSGLHRKIHELLEKNVVTAAMAVVSASPNVTSYFSGKYGGPADKFSTITNGFDPEDFTGLKTAEINTAKLTMTFSGSIYGYVDPIPLLTVLKELTDAGIIARDKLRLRFTGNFWFNEAPMEKYKGLCEITPYATHREAVKQMLESDILLVLLRKSPNRIQAKIFEYFAAQKPVLAIVPPGGIAAELIRKYKAGFVADPENNDDIRESILEIYRLWSDRKLHLQPDIDFVKTFDRRLLTQKLAGILDKIYLKKSRQQ